MRACLCELRHRNSQRGVIDVNKRQKKKSANRIKKEYEFRRLTNKANKILKRFDETNKRYVLDDDYGATFHDKTIVNKQGKFRNNASQLNMKELDQRIGMMNTFIEDSDEYFMEAEEFTEFGHKMGEWAESHGASYDIGQDLSEFMTYVQSIMGLNYTPSDVMDVAKNRLNEGDNLGVLKRTFYYAWTHSQTADEFIHFFGAQGIYL